jgi:hypothetical protein
MQNVEIVAYILLTEIKEMKEILLQFHTCARLRVSIKYLSTFSLNHM